MAPAKQNLTIYQGDDFILDVVLSVDGSPFNVAGWTFAAQVRKTTADADGGPGPAGTYAAFTCTVVDAPGGRIRLSLSHTLTQSLTETAGNWDLQASDPGGLITTLLSGTVAITKEITRP